MPCKFEGISLADEELISTSVTSKVQARLSMPAKHNQLCIKILYTTANTLIDVPAHAANECYQPVDAPLHCCHLKAYGTNIDT
jgi:hypothetical protein